MIFPWEKFFLHTKFIFLTWIPLILISRQRVAMEGSIWVAGVGRKLLSNCFNILTAWAISSKHRQCSPSLDNALPAWNIFLQLGQYPPNTDNTLLAWTMLSQLGIYSSSLYNILQTQRMRSKCFDVRPHSANPIAGTSIPRWLCIHGKHAFPDHGGNPVFGISTAAPTSSLPPWEPPHRGAASAWKHRVTDEIQGNIGPWMNYKKGHTYDIQGNYDIDDKVSANTASSVPKNSKFQSGHRVVTIVLNN